ncbi:hypothetical protein J31TS4_19170 [Paenibacillus sp. J31TS4]|nr:hypothetical protein J31TS4_19170 [Paenibacillus sp. J31TS4]
MIDGYNLRADMEMQRLAWHAANVMNVHLRKKVTVKRLLGKEKLQTQEDKQSEFAKLIDLMSRRGR